MKLALFRICILLLLAFAPAPVAAGPGTVRTIAIWDFDNNSVADLASITAVDYLSRAIPEMLITKLNDVPGLKLVERVHLRQALEELKLGSNKLTDEDSRLKLGKLVGAKQMAFGSYMAIGPTIRIDVRVVEVATSLTLLAEAVDGSVNNIPALADNLAKKVATKISGSSPKSVTSTSEKDLKIWQAYDKGVILMDKKKFDEAITVFEALLKAHPDFKPAEKQITLAAEKLSRQ